MLVDKQTHKRIMLPVASEVVLAAGQWYAFHSNIEMNDHREFNNLLNHLVSQKRLHYRHKRQTDQFFGNCRVSLDAETGIAIAKIRKERIADLHIHFPSNKWDVRLSINEEIPVSEAPSGDSKSKERFKDRMEYKTLDNLFQIDLTQVSQTVGLNDRGGGRKEVTHELEIEWLGMDALAAEARKVAIPGTQNAFVPLVRGFVSILRNVIRKGSQFRKAAH